MPVLSTREHREREADTPSQGDDAWNRELVAVRYVGSQSAYRNQAVRNQGGWPGKGNFQNGQWYVALVPEENLGWWESHADFEIGYDDGTIAESFLNENYLPTEVFSNRANGRLRERVFDHLGLDAAMDEEGYREQLRELAGIDEDEDEGSADEQSRRAAEIEDNYERSDYKRAIETLREDDDEMALNASHEEMVAYLAADERDADRVDSLLSGAGSGESE